VTGSDNFLERSPKSSPGKKTKRAVVKKILLTTSWSTYLQNSAAF